MMRLKTGVDIFCRSDSGATAIEYAMVACFIFLAIAGSVAAVGQSVMTVLYDKIETLF